MSRAVAAAVTWSAAVALNRALVRVRGVSMTPTLAPGDVVLTVPRRRPRRGDVVILRDPRRPARTQVKRVVGLPGEVVRIEQGRLLLDGIEHEEPYATGRGPDGALDVPADHVAVMGDDRTRSTDSRVYGAVPMHLLDATAVLRVTSPVGLLRARPIGRGDVDDHGRDGLG